jgi:phospholipid/cholesterol/gamma-HCH transport system substrate-binding protein
MRLTRPMLVNLIAFLTIAVVLVVLGIVNLLGNPLRGHTEISAVFPDASGLHSGFDVTLDGVDVGVISHVQLAAHGVRVVLRLDPGVEVPGDVVASVDLANALGEQQIDLVPARGGRAPALRDGAVVPVNPNGLPASVGRLVQVATQLFDAIPPGDLNSVLHELALGLQGRGADLRTINDAGRTFAQEFLAYQTQFEQLLSNAPPVLDAVSASGPQLQAALANTAVLLQILADRRTELANAIGQGSTAAQDLLTIDATELPNLACLIHDFSELTVNLAQPANLFNLNTSLLTNNYFFGAVDGVSQPGPAASLYPGDPARSGQYWLRTRLLFPPAQPAASQYSAPKILPTTRPGAGCQTELGNGVGPATQAHPSPPGPGGAVVPPPAAASVVRGGQPDPAGETAAFRVPAPAGPAGPTGSSEWLMVLGAVLIGGLGWFAHLALPTDPVRRVRRGRNRDRMGP